MEEILSSYSPDPIQGPFASVHTQAWAWNTRSLARALGLVLVWVSTPEAAGVPTRPSCSLPKCVLTVERVFFLSFCGSEFQAMITRKLWVLPFFLRCWLVIWIWFHNSQARLVNTILNLKRQFGKVPGYVQWISQLKYSSVGHTLAPSGPSSTAVAGIWKPASAFRFCLNKTGSDSYLCFQGRD